MTTFEVLALIMLAVIEGTLIAVLRFLYLGFDHLNNMWKVK